MPITPGGSEPMIIAEALASDDIALILPRSRLRSRSTPARLASASDRLPPDFCWIVITMPKKFTSTVGMLSNIFRTPCSSVTPTLSPSHSLLNSLPTGSGNSRATMRSASLVGRPERTLRTMTSIALANSAVNRFSRRDLRKLRTQRGRPRPTVNAASTVTMMVWPNTRQKNAVSSPRPPEAIQNARGVALGKPACSRRWRIVSFCFFSACRFSISFSCAWTFLRLKAASTGVLMLRAVTCGLAMALTRLVEIPLLPAKANTAPPSASTVNMTTITRTICASHLHGVERLGQLALEIVVPGALPEVRPHDACANMLALQPAGFVFAADFVVEQILGDHHVAFGAHHL